MLQTLGVSCKISNLYDEGYRDLPANNGTGENKPFLCKKSYRLLITSYDTFKLVSLGLVLHRLKVKARRPQRDAKQFNKVVSVLDEGRISDTYCFTEAKRGMGMFNGILTGNCNEIHLMTSAKRTAVCCLSSLNLAKYDEWKDTNIVQDLCRYLDNILEYFIRLAPSQLKRAVHSASQERAIGIGTLGWHSLLQKRNLAFESGGANSAASLNYEVYTHIESEFIKASQQLALERGEPEDCIGGGMRNSHGIAIAPNVSSADMVGESCSIEPWKSNAFVAQGRSGSFLVKNKYLESVLEKLGRNTGDVWKQILEADGSVAGLDFLTDQDKKVFATAKEIDPMWIIEHASIRQPHICQGQSINTFKDNSWTMQDMIDLHIAAWAKGLKGLYYMRGEAADSVNVTDKIKPPLNQVRPVFKLDECLSCHG
jgi:ribonucleoside-diphosphate reductase alpha chain